MATTLVTSVGTIAPYPDLYPGFPLEGGTYCCSFVPSVFAEPLTPVGFDTFVPPATKDFPSKPTMSISEPWRDFVCETLFHATLGSSALIGTVGFFATLLPLLYFEFMAVPNYFGPVACQFK